MKKIYLLPNLVTTANLVFGFLSMVHAIKGDFARSAWFIVVGGVCDSLDGRIARFARATSPFGVQFDSLSDLTSFGIAPAILFFSYVLKDHPLGVAACVFYVVTVALRLARFNVSAEEQDPSRLKKIRKGYFQGMPSPAAAGILVSTVLVQLEYSLFDSDWAPNVFLGITLLVAALMVSNVSFSSFKEVNWRSKGGAWMLLIPVAFILSMFQVPEVTLFCVGQTYLWLGLVWAIYLKVSDRKANSGAQLVKQ